MQNLHSSARTAAKTKFKSWGLTTSATIATILMLAAGLISSCEMPETKKINFIDSYDYGITKIIEIDSCQYILHTGYKETAITHKGNCKYCLTRKK
jgi:hypothetical protein